MTLKILEKTNQVLVAANEATKSLNLSPNEIKPCVAMMMQIGFEKGGFPDRSRAANIIASELLRIGKDEDEIEFLITMWNEKNNHPLSNSKLKSTLNTAIRKEETGGYRYSCNSEYLKPFCIEDFCSYRNAKTQGRSKYTNNRLYYTYGWQFILSNVEKLIYFALIELERRKGVYAGGLIISNYRNIACITGTSLKYIGKGLRGLKEKGLIEYEAGVPRKWEGKASKIRRIIPIPKPNKKQLIEIESKRQGIYGINNHK